jgi:branched-chain amino acid transport system ATP-binding protein
MVEQNAYAALEMCDYAYLMEAGSIVLSGRGSELIHNKHIREAYLGG